MIFLKRDSITETLLKQEKDNKGRILNITVINKYNEISLKLENTYFTNNITKSKLFIQSCMKSYIFTYKNKELISIIDTKSNKEHISPIKSGNIIIGYKYHSSFENAKHFNILYSTIYLSHKFDLPNTKSNSYIYILKDNRYSYYIKTIEDINNTKKSNLKEYIRIDRQKNSLLNISLIYYTNSTNSNKICFKYSDNMISKDIEIYPSQNFVYIYELGKNRYLSSDCIVNIEELVDYIKTLPCTSFKGIIDLKFYLKDNDS